MKKLDDIIKDSISNEDMEFIKDKLQNIDLRFYNKLLSLVQYVYNIDDILTTRCKRASIAKKVFLYLLHEMGDMTYREIGFTYNIDLRTIYLAKKYITNNLSKDYILREKIELIKSIMSYDSNKFQGSN